MITNTSSNKIGDRTYRSAVAELLGKKFNILEVTGPGKHDNYICVSVIKHMPNPGRVFLNFAAAIEGYKSLDMKLAIKEAARLFTPIGINP